MGRGFRAWPNVLQVPVFCFSPDRVRVQRDILFPLLIPHSFPTKAVWHMRAGYCHESHAELSAWTDTLRSAHMGPSTAPERANDGTKLRKVDATTYVADPSFAKPGYAGPILQLFCSVCGLMHDVMLCKRAGECLFRDKIGRLWRSRESERAPDMN